jgi:phosphoserine phosphatase
MLVSFLGLWPLSLIPDGQRGVNSALLWWATVGLGRPATLALIRDYALGLRSDPTLLLPGGVRRLREHRERGERIWIVSASCRQWIRPVLAAAGQEKAMVVASSFAFCCGGLVMARRCHGHGKVRELERRAKESRWRWTWAYGDRLSDLPILGLAGRQGLVGPSRQARRAAQRLGSSATVLNWRS